MHSFRTPNTNSFRFAAVGDPQLTRGTQDATSNLFSADKTIAQGLKDTMIRTADKDVDFIAGVGDEVDLTSKDDEVEYRNFFAPAELRAIPFSPVVGNHDHV